MLLDVLNSDNYIICNRNLANVLGLAASVYCSELLSIYKKAMKKNKLIDGEFFEVDRAYITSRTTLTLEEQLVIDKKWTKINLMQKKNDFQDIIKIDISLILSIITTEDESALKDIVKKVSVNTKTQQRETKRTCICENIKKTIECSNPELLNALRDWVDSIYAKPNGYLTKAIIQTFQKTLYDYTEGDLDKALQIVKIATIQGYKDCAWAINSYERENAFNKSCCKYSTQQTASSNNLSKEIF